MLVDIDGIRNLQVCVNNVLYSVRHNYLHRGQKPRLVLDHKESGQFVSIHFDIGGTIFSLNTDYKAYWVNKQGFSDIQCKIIKNIHAT